MCLFRNLYHCCVTYPSNILQLYITVDYSYFLLIVRLALEIYIYIFIRNQPSDSMSCQPSIYITGRFYILSCLDNIIDVYCYWFLHTGHAMPIRSLCFSPDSQLLVTVSDDSHIKLYDV